MDVRSRRMAMEYMVGKSVEQIATTEFLSVQRVYQIIDKVARSLRFQTAKQMKYMGSDWVLRRLRSTPYMHLGGEQATTPEEFFFELLHEKRQVNP